MRSEQRKKMKGGINKKGKNVRRKSVFRWDPGGKNPFEKEKKEKGLDRVELRSWTENAPRNIPDIVWEQFSRQPRTTSASHYGIKVRRWPDLCRLQPLYRELL